MGENGYQKLNQDNLQKAIEIKFENQDTIVIDNGDGTFEISLKDRIYELKDNEIRHKQVDLYISNKEELKRFRDEVNNGNTYKGKYILLTQDITLDSSEEWDPIGYYSPESSTPDDQKNKPFCGSFNGMGHYINGIKIGSKEKVKGFFGLIAEGASIKNLNIGENNNINGGLAVAGIVGYSYNSKIVNCQNYAKIVADTQSGGVVGILSNSILKNSSNLGEVTGNVQIGGIVGNCLTTSNVKECINKAKVSGKELIGGISGNVAKDSILENCANISDINGNDDSKYIGGITGGLKNSKLLACYNIGKIKGNEGISGIAGWGYDMRIDSCYNNATIINGVEVKNKQQMQKLANNLGKRFKEDTQNKNDGFPILDWQ